MLGSGAFLTYEHSCLVSIDPQVQAFLPRLPDLRPQPQQAREDAPEPERGGRKGAPSGHASADLLAGGSRRWDSSGRTDPNLQRRSCPSAAPAETSARVASRSGRVSPGDPEEEGGKERREPGCRRGRGSERGRHRRETGRAADASTPGETHSQRVKYGERGRAGREGASGVRVRSDEAQRAAAGGRCGARGGGAARDPRGCVSPAVGPEGTRAKRAPGGGGCEKRVLGGTPRTALAYDSSQARHGPREIVWAELSGLDWAPMMEKTGPICTLVLNEGAFSPPSPFPPVIPLSLSAKPSSLIRATLTCCALPCTENPSLRRPVLPRSQALGLTRGAGFHSALVGHPGRCLHSWGGPSLRWPGSAWKSSLGSGWQESLTP